MPGTAIATQTGRYSVLQAELPGQGLVNIGVLLQDPHTDSLHLRLRRDLETLSEEADDLLPLLSDDFAAKAREMGSEQFFQYLENTLSNTLRITNRESVLVEDFPRAVNRLYRVHVESNVLQFRTHLPQYTLRAAAGKFLENEEVSEEGWIETPEDLRLTPDMFVAEIVGHSMEPHIPDGSICVFRHGVTGSRKGRLVLVENREDNSFAVKRYLSEKSEGEEWRHTRIRLESLNPDYESWDLEPDSEKYRVIAEFVRVLD